MSAVKRVPRTKVVSMRLTDDEYVALSARADQLGVDLSELIRRAALALTYPPPPPTSCATFTWSAQLARVDWQTS